MTGIIMGKLKTLMCILAVVCMVSSGCSGMEKTSPVQAQDVLSSGELELIEDTEFGMVYLDVTNEEFLNLGFELGDSVRIEFSNGYVQEDIPVYSGFFTSLGEPMIVLYPTYDHISFSLNGPPTWSEINPNDDTTAVITLLERGKYSLIQESCDLHHSNNRDDFESDIQFANFREFSEGNMREGVFYRSSSPCNNKYKRAAYVDTFCEEAGIQHILDLADTVENIEGYMAKDDFNSPYFKSLYEKGQVHPLSLNMNLKSENFATVISAGLLDLCGTEGPYLISCTEGKDRTGFVTALIMALGGATPEEVAADYMITYDNFYGLTMESDSQKYTTLVNLKIGDYMCYFNGLSGKETDIDWRDITAEDLHKGAEEYLRLGGLEDEEIAKIEALICD